MTGSDTRELFEEIADDHRHSRSDRKLAKAVYQRALLAAFGTLLFGQSVVLVLTILSLSQQDADPRAFSAALQLHCYGFFLITLPVTFACAKVSFRLFDNERLSIVAMTILFAAIFDLLFISWIAVSLFTGK